ncbi:MAG: hypothetical protein ACKVP0_22990 [Pirellulaceae bacterium]
MQWTNQTADTIREMVMYFLPHCSDQSTMSELKEMTSDSKSWRQAHKLFGRIRKKTLKADELNDRRLQCQYSFEEICAKTLYNIADHHEGFSAEYLPPFDNDSPFWVVPIAVTFAHELGLNALPMGSGVLRFEEAG